MYFNDAKFGENVKKRVLRADENKLRQLCERFKINPIMGDLFLTEIILMSDEAKKLSRNAEIFQAAKLLGLI